ncbi:MAG: DUF1353 domain-containing protein, partial [Methylococcales bacterium]
MSTHPPKLRRPWFDTLFKAVTGVGAVIVTASSQLAPGLLVPLLLAGSVLYVGFGLPRWVGWCERRKRALDAKKWEETKWGFHSRDREGPWLNYIDFSLRTTTPIATDKYFYSDWLIIHDGKIVVNPGPTKGAPDLKGTVDYDFIVRRAYAWDGCTPKRWFFWLALFGTPDWDEKIEEVETFDTAFMPISKSVFWQRAHHASLVHDALYQYLDRIPIAKQDVDQLFHDMLLDSGFHPWVAKIYHLAVRFFGAEDVNENSPGPNTRLTLS